MKRSFVLLAMFLVLTVSVFAKKVEVQTARHAAQSFLNANMDTPPEISLIDFTDQESFLGFYVFGNNRCFVIIAADDCVHPILGYSTDCAFVTNEMPANTFAWLKAYDEEIAYVSESRLEADDAIRSEWDSLLDGRGLEPKSRSSVSPLLRTRWNQGMPFNNLCPADPNATDGHVLAGCVATAMAQIMNYWEHPTRGSGTYSYTPQSHPEYGVQFADFRNTNYDWDHMKNVYSRGYSDAEANAVATLVYHCGVAVDMDYGPEVSTASTQKVPVALNTYFDYSDNMNLKQKSYITNNGSVHVIYTDAQWRSMLKTELNAHRPLYYSGGYYIAKESGSHAFVCDGYDANNFFHFNWGWGGAYDGYYAIGALNPGVGPTGQFNQWNYALFGCSPKATSINPPSSVNATVNGRNVSVSWNSVSNAVSYKLYRDGDLVANLTNTNYTEVNVSYGMHSYYVKSVKSNGVMSMKSNDAVADVHFSGPVPTSLQASVNNNDVSLSWQSQIPVNAVLQYGSGNCIGGFGYDEGGVYWAQRYPVSILDDYAGMAVQKVSFYSRCNANYTLFIYKGDETNTTELVYQKNQNAGANNWQDIILPNPVTIDYTQDLWIVLYCDQNSPASYCSYSGAEVEDASLYSRLGNAWSFCTDKSWLIKTYITDGTYTYNLYRNGTALATQLTGNTYSDANLPEGSFNYHVTTNYFGGESDPSNSVNVQVESLTFTIGATANPSTGGSVTGAGIYTYGETCTLSASSNLGYTFVNWTENGTPVSTNPTYSFTVTESANYVAHFELDNYHVTVSASPSNGGSVSGGGTFHYGDNCTVHATANSGFNFINWTINGVPVYNNPTYSFTVTTDCQLVANFTMQSYVITAMANPSEGGSVTGSGGYNYGDNCTLTATANMGYTFQKWTKNGVTVSYSPTYSFTVTESATYYAYFTAQSFTVSVLADPSDGGSVGGGGTYIFGQSCTVHATANPGYSFDHWTENGNIVSNQADYSFTVTGNRTLLAHFTLVTYEISAETNPEGVGVITGTGLYHYGETATLTVEPSSHYNFRSWSENGEFITEDSTFQIVVTGPRHFIANFVYFDALEESASTIEIFPNPSNTILYVQGEGMRRLTVYNVIGQVMDDLEVVGQEQLHIDVHDYGQGLYILHVQTRKGPIVMKFVKE